MAIQNPKAPLDVKGAYRLDWMPGATAIRRLVLADKPKTIQVFDNGDGAYLEQFMLGGENVVTVLSATTEKGFAAIDSLFENDKLFDKLQMGAVKQISLLDVRDVNDVNIEPFHAERAPEKRGLWDTLMSWLRNIPWAWVFGGLLLLFAVLILLPLALNRIRQR